MQQSVTLHPLPIKPVSLNLHQELIRPGFLIWEGENRVNP